MHMIQRFITAIFLGVALLAASCSSENEGSEGVTSEASGDSLATDIKSDTDSVIVEEIPNKFLIAAMQLPDSFPHFKHQHPGTIDTLVGEYQNHWLISNIEKMRTQIERTGKPNKMVKPPPVSDYGLISSIYRVHLGYTTNLTDIAIEKWQFETPEHANYWESILTDSLRGAFMTKPPRFQWVEGKDIYLISTRSYQQWLAYKDMLLQLLQYESNQILGASLAVPYTPSDVMGMESNIVTIKGKEFYFEKYGSGEPLLLLHGYLQSSKSWHGFVDEFSDEYTVYLLDLPGHGQSTPFQEDFSIKSIVGDVEAFIEHMDMKGSKAIGFSFGGDVLYHLAAEKPGIIQSMICIGSLGTWDVNDFPDLIADYTYEKYGQLAETQAHHSNDDQVRILFKQFLNYSIALTDEDLKRISSPVLIVAGDDDSSTPLTEIARVRQLLGNSDLWVLPNVPHSAHDGENKADFIAKAKEFLHRY